jgi:large subunit ribosomal protein L17
MPRIKNKRRFGRKKDQRRALLLSLVRALVIHERIQTTEAKAKELRSLVEKIVTRSKEDTIHNRRILVKKLSESVAKKLVKEIGPRYKDRSGGYTRIVKVGPRLEDSARMAIIEFV